MQYVHIFVGKDNLIKLDDINTYCDPIYTEDGDRIDSKFFSEIGLTHYEPACIERVVVGKDIDIADALLPCSFSSRWIHLLPKMIITHSILIYRPNEITKVNTTMVRYIGKYEF